MAIVIVNDGSNKSQEGIHHCTVRINQNKICEFDHFREEGLAVCLFRAAEAVARAKEVEGRELATAMYHSEFH